MPWANSRLLGTQLCFQGHCAEVSDLFNDECSDLTPKKKRPGTSRDVSPHLARCHWHNFRPMPKAAKQPPMEKAVPCVAKASTQAPPTAAGPPEGRPAAAVAAAGGYQLNSHGELVAWRQAIENVLREDRGKVCGLVVLVAVAVCAHQGSKVCRFPGLQLAQRSAFVVWF